MALGLTSGSQSLQSPWFGVKPSPSRSPSGVASHPVVPELVLVMVPLEVEVPPHKGGYVSLLTGTIAGGEELRLSCVASPLVIEALRPDCLRMIASMQRRP